MDVESADRPASRLGLHYYPDANHYRTSDLRTWVPELQALGARWLVLLAPSDRAIPEAFLKGLLAAGVEPVLRFPLSLYSPPPAEDLQVLFEAYSRWGVRYAALFDRPNRRRAWQPSEWARQELVERFIDLFLPAAEGAARAGLQPLFPPLEPGGDYWDTAFLRTALEALRRRASRALLDRLGLGAYAWTGDRPLAWGAGGPERWPAARPYYLTPEGEDQRGFRIFDWYLALAEAALGRRLPIHLLGIGAHPLGQAGLPETAVDEEGLAALSLEIARLLAGETVPRSPEGVDQQLPPELISGSFWLLAADPESPFQGAAWFKDDGASPAVVGAIGQWRASLDGGSMNERAGAQSPPAPARSRPIAHYLLLPSPDRGLAGMVLETVQPFIWSHRPTMGFSLVEAAQATRVTVFGGPDCFPDAVVEELRGAGCRVDRLLTDGTGIAPQPA